MTFKNNLRKLLKEKDISGAELSRACNIAQSTVYGLMSGNVKMWGNYRKKITEYLNVTEEELMGEEKE